MQVSLLQNSQNDVIQGVEYTKHVNYAVTEFSYLLGVFSHLMITAPPKGKNPNLACNHRPCYREYNVKIHLFVLGCLPATPVLALFSSCSLLGYLSRYN